VEVFLPAYTWGRHTEHTQTSMPSMGFEPTISVLERAKTVRALDRAVTAIGLRSLAVRLPSVASIACCESIYWQHRQKHGNLHSSEVKLSL
jgi:hypothetical protein